MGKNVCKCLSMLILDNGKHCYVNTYRCLFYLLMYAILQLKVNVILDDLSDPLHCVK
jgi:hypothetical protein